jgi:hypothetical protein
MGGEHFDNLVATVTETENRRGVLQKLGTGLASLLMAIGLIEADGPEVEARKRRRRRRRGRRGGGSSATSGGTGGIGGTGGTGGTGGPGGENTNTNTVTNNVTVIVDADGDGVPDTCAGGFCKDDNDCDLPCCCRKGFCVSEPSACGA